MQKLFTFFIFLSLFFISSLALAATLTVVNSQSCIKAKNMDKPFLLVLYKGENLLQSLTHCANAAQLSGASFIGLGALKDPTINFFNFQTKKYQDKTFPGYFELISLNGDIAKGENSQRMIHAHVTLGNENYQTIGGHLSNGVVSATAEITIIPFNGELIRKLDSNIGAALITTEKTSSVKP